MACKVTKSLNTKVCSYAVAGVAMAYLANWYPPVEVAAESAPVAGQIGYVKDTDGYIIEIILPPTEKFFEIEGAENTVSYSDLLLAGGNGGMYRQHAVNAVLNQYDLGTLEEGDAMSLGKFIWVTIDKAGRIVLLGRTGGIKAPAGGFDYNSGAAEADATGWTVIQQGVSMEIAPLVKSKAVITPVYEAVIVP